MTPPRSGRTILDHSGVTRTAPGRRPRPRPPSAAPQEPNSVRRSGRMERPFRLFHPVPPHPRPAREP